MSESKDKEEEPASGEIVIKADEGKLKELKQEAAKRLNIPEDKVDRIYVPANCFWYWSDDSTKFGRYFIPYGFYNISSAVPGAEVGGKDGKDAKGGNKGKGKDGDKDGKDGKAGDKGKGTDADKGKGKGKDGVKGKGNEKGASGEKYKLIPVAVKKDDIIEEFGPSVGTITSVHLQNLTLFEAILERLAASSKPAPACVVEAAPAGSLPSASPLLRLLRGNVCSIVFSYLLPPNKLGTFSFSFDAGILGLQSASRALARVVSLHPVWITSILGLSYKHLGAVLAYLGLSCAGVARYISLNAARLPDVIRKDPEFRNILRPETRHKILEKQAAMHSPAGPELSPKERSLQLIGSFLLGEPAYRGDTENDPVTAELLALCQKIAKDDPVFVLKLAHYVRNTLTFRNTTNFLLACAVKIETCQPYVRTALPKCTNLPTDLLELWDFWRKLSGSIKLPSCLKKGFADKFKDFSAYQLGKYLNAKVPKPQQIVAKPAGKKKGLDEKDPEVEKAKKAEEEAKMKDPLKRPLTLKTLIRTTHAGKGQAETACGVLRKLYPTDEAEFKEMGLDADGSQFDPKRVGAKFRIPVPKTWETELSEKGNTPAVWEELVKSKSLPFMAMLRNLRNLLMAGVSEQTHKTIIGRLRSQHQVASSKQMPVKFLSAFEAIDFDDETLATLAEEAKSESDFVEYEKAYGEGKDAKKVKRKRRVCRNPPTKKLLDEYRDALEMAVSLAASNNVPPLECPTGGKAVVLVDVSGSMEGKLTQGPKKLHESALTPHRRSNVSAGRPIVEGQDMDLEDYFSQSGQRLSKKLSVSQTWIGRDLDLSCAVLDKDGNNIIEVSYQQLEASAVWHSGDITDAPYGAEEIITVDLDALPENCYMLVFTVNSYSGERFDEMSEAAVSLRDDGLEGDSVEGTREICAFRLTGSHKAVIACSLIRKERGWAFRCINTPQAKGATVQSLLGKIRKEYEAQMADAATNGKRLVDASILLALCLRERMGDDKCEVVVFSSSSTSGGPGYYVLRHLGPKVLANVRRCHAVCKQLGRGTELPIEYLQELSAAEVKLDHLVLLSDGLIAPAKNPGSGLSRWLASYRARVQPVKYTCIDVLGLGKPSVGDGTPQDVLISGYSEAVLRYLTQEAGAQLAEVEAIELPPPKKKEEGADKEKIEFAPPPREGDK